MTARILLAAVTFLSLAAWEDTVLAQGRGGGGGGGSSSCTFATTPVVFGVYNVFDLSPLVSTGAVIFRCGPQVATVSISLDPGQSGSYAGRTLVGLPDSLTYNLFLDAARTIVWGDGTGGSQAYVNNDPPKNADVNLSVYAEIGASQDVGPGLYADLVTATINF